jgi:hypothetical protein
MTWRKRATPAPAFKQPSPFNPTTGQHAAIGPDSPIPAVGMFRVIATDTYDDYVVCQGYDLTTDPACKYLLKSVAVAKPYGVRGTFPYQVGWVLAACKARSVFGDNPGVASVTVGQPANLGEAIDMLKDANGNPINWLDLGSAGGVDNRFFSATLYETLTSGMATVTVTWGSPLDGGEALTTAPTSVGNTAGFSGSTGDVVVVRETANDSDPTAAAAWEIVSIESAGSAIWKYLSGSSGPIYYADKVLVGTNAADASVSGPGINGSYTGGSATEQVAGDIHLVDPGSGNDLWLQPNDPISGMAAISSPKTGFSAIYGSVFIIDTGTIPLTLPGPTLAFSDPTFSYLSSIVQSANTNSLIYNSSTNKHIFEGTLNDDTSGEIVSINPGSRLLADSSGNTVLDWAYAGTIQIVNGANRLRLACDSSSNLVLSYPDSSVTSANGSCTFSIAEVSALYYNTITIATAVGGHKATIVVDQDGGIVINPGADGTGGSNQAITLNSTAASIFYGSITGSSTSLVVDGPVNCASVAPNNGFSGTVALAKLTPVTGSNGSLTVSHGIITAYTAPT